MAKNSQGRGRRGSVGIVGPPGPGWEIVRTAADMMECRDCGEPYCIRHLQHYADCPCLGPTEDDVTYAEYDGVTYGKRTTDPTR